MLVLLAVLACASPPAVTAVDAAAVTAVEAPIVTAAEEGCPASTASIETPTDKRLQGDAVVVVFKATRWVGLYQKGERAGCWKTGLAAGYVEGHKQRRGDMRTPEGWYRTSDKPWSSFYAAIAVHYPEAADARRGLKAGLIDQAQHDAILAALTAGKKPPQNTRLGGEILIHGGGGSTDWTLGCVALDDEHLDLLRTRLPASMAFDVLILP